MKRRFLAGMLLCVLLTGCGRARPLEKSVVCEIHVSMGEKDGSFTGQKDMIKILDALRNRGQTTHLRLDPNALPTTACRVLLCRTDGTRLEYQFAPDRYIRCGSETWREMNPENYREITELLGEMLSLSRGP